MDVIVDSNVSDEYKKETDEMKTYVYVNCDPHSSWEDLAKKLYHHQEVTAVEEVKLYLAPRGEPCL